MNQTHRMFVVLSRWLCVWMLLVCVTSSAQAQMYWNQYRGPHGDGTLGADELRAAEVPTTWSETENVRWKTEFPGKAWSSPVVWGEQIWMTNATPDGKVLSVLCLDLATGEILRDQVVFEIEEPQFCIERNSYASNTPVIEEGRVYLHFGAHGTACMDTQTGAVLWSRQDIECDHHRGPASSPILWNDRLILTYDGFDHQFLLALDKTTGETLWRTDRGFAYDIDDGDAKKAYSTPLIIEHEGRTELVSPSAGACAAYDPQTGKELWRVKSGGMNSATRPVYDRGLVVMGTADGGFQTFSVRPGGSGDVTDTELAWKLKKGAPRYASPLALDGLLYMGNEKGILTCAEVETGEDVWQNRVGGLFMASPISLGDRIFFCNEEGTCVVIQAGREFKVLAENKIEGEIMASPAVADGMLLIRTKSGLYAIGSP